jgi:hypothetical protein
MPFNSLDPLWQRRRGRGELFNARIEEGKRKA